MTLCSVQVDFAYNFQVQNAPGILTHLGILKDVLRRISHVCGSLPHTLSDILAMKYQM